MDLLRGAGFVLQRLSRLPFTELWDPRERALFIRYSPGGVSFAIEMETSERSRASLTRVQEEAR